MTDETKSGITGCFRVVSVERFDGWLCMCKLSLGVTRETTMNIFLEVWKGVVYGNGILFELISMDCGYCSSRDRQLWLGHV